MNENEKKIGTKAPEAGDNQRYIVVVTTVPEPEEVDNLTIEGKRNYLWIRGELLKDADDEEGQFIFYNRDSERDAIVTALDALRILKKASPHKCLVDRINIHTMPMENEWTAKAQSFLSDWLVHSEVLKNL